MKKLIKVVIDRKRWYRGKGDLGNSMLRTPSRKQCCLGFACRVLGAKAKDILGKAMPDDVSDDIDLPGLVVPALFSSGKNSSHFSSRAAIINDDMDISDRSRESKLRALAKASGFRFQFIN